MTKLLCENETNIKRLIMRKYDFAKVWTRPMPSLCDLDNKWIFGGVRCVINVSACDTIDLLKAYKKRGIEYHFFPLREEVRDLGWDNYKLAVACLLAQIEKGVPTIVHCDGGNHRSPMVVEGAYYALHGRQLEDEYKGAPNHLLYDLENNHFPKSTQEALEEIGQLCGAGKKHVVCGHISNEQL